MRGIAVHIAARIEALAEPGDVLASSTTRDLAEAADVIFRARGAHALKGVSGEWQLYGVEPTTLGTTER